MTEIAGFQIDQPLRSDGIVTTYIASKPGEPEGRRYELKLYQSPATILGTPRAALEVSRFLEIGRRLQEASQASERFLPVKALESRKGSAILITEVLPYTLQTLIDIRRRPVADEMRHLVAQVIRAMHEYHARTGHGHGNIVPGNIYIDRLDDLTEARVVLGEPALLLDADPEHGEAIDCQAMARVINCLVEFQPSWAPVRWPVQASPNWKQVGRSAERWRDLTNFLLDPTAREKGQLPDLACLPDELPVEPVNLGRPLRWAAAAVVVLAAGGGAYMLYSNRAIALEMVAPARDSIAYVSQQHIDWLRAFRRDVEGRTPLAEFENDPTVQADVAKLRAEVIQPLVTVSIRDRSDYNRFFDQSAYITALVGEGANWEGINRYVNNPDLDLEAFRSEIGQNDLELIEAVEARIGQVRQALKSWATGRTEAEVQMLLDLDLPRALEDAEALRDQVAAEEFVPPIEDIKSLLGRARDLEKVREVWTRVDRLDDAARGQNLALLDDLPDVLRTHIRESASTTDAFAMLSEPRIAGLIASLTQMLGADAQKIAWTLFADDFQAPATWTVDAYATLATRLAEYYLIDPLPEAPPVYISQQGVLDELVEQLRACEEDEADKFVDLKAGYGKVYEEFRGLTPIRRNEEQIDGLKASLAAFPQLVDQCRDAVATYCIPPQKYYDEMQSITFRSAALQSDWRTTVASIAELRGMPDVGYDTARYLELRQPVDAKRKLFDHLESEAFRVGDPPPPAGSIATLPPGPSDWSRDLALAAVGSRREEAIAAVVLRVNEVIGRGDRRPTIASESIAGEIGKQTDDMNDWYASAADLLARCAELERRLDLGYTLDEPFASSDARTIRALREGFAAEATRIVFDALRNSLAALLARYEQLPAIAARQDSAELAALARDTDVYIRPEIFVAIWDRLGELAREGRHLRLADDLAVREELVKWLDAKLVGHDERRTMLADRFTDQSHDHWRSVMAARPLPAADNDAELGAYEDDLRLFNDFHVREVELEPWLRWNLDLLAFRGDLAGLEAQQAVEAEVRQAQARDQIRAFRDDAGTTYGELLTGRPALTGLMADLVEIASEERKAVDFAQSGPELGTGGRFKYEERPETSLVRGLPSRVLYRLDLRGSDNDIDLEFILLDSKAHEALTRPVYISATEVTVRMFANVFQHSSHLDTLSPLFKRDYYGSGQLWHRRGTTVVPAVADRGSESSQPSWINIDTRRAPAADFAADVETPLPPTIDHPMQFISPIAAIYVARAYGCRLPTTTEFQAAFAEQYGRRSAREVIADAAAGRLAMPNLCDEQVRRQKEHVAGVMARPGNTAPDFAPEMESFHTWPDNKRYRRDFGGDYSYAFDDGRLYFDQFDSGPGPFFHLLGNVMEWVYDAPDDLSPIEGAQPVSIADITRLVRNESFGAIGGSALSPKSFDPLQRVELNHDDMALRQDIEGYNCTDVGFRLVIAGHFDSMAQQTLAATRIAYLAGPR